MSFESLEKTYFHKKTCFQTFPKCFQNGNTKSAEKYYKNIVVQIAIKCIKADLDYTNIAKRVEIVPEPEPEPEKPTVSSEDQTFMTTCMQTMMAMMKEMRAKKKRE